MKPSRLVSLLLRALSRAVGRLLRPMTKLLPSPSLPALRDLPRPGQVVDSLRPGSSPSKKDGKEIEPPHEADLPDALTRAGGLPIQHAALLAVPVEIAYNQFTQFTDFPDFMRAVANVDQVDPAQADFDVRRWTTRTAPTRKTNLNGQETDDSFRRSPTHCGVPPRYPNPLDARGHPAGSRRDPHGFRLDGPCRGRASALLLTHRVPSARLKSHLGFATARLRSAETEDQQGGSSHV